MAPMWLLRETLVYQVHQNFDMMAHTQTHHKTNMNTEKQSLENAEFQFQQHQNSSL